MKESVTPVWTATRLRGFAVACPQAATKGSLGLRRGHILHSKVGYPSIVGHIPSQNRGQEPGANNGLYEGDLFEFV